MVFGVELPVQSEVGHWQAAVQRCLQRCGPRTTLDARPARKILKIFGPPVNFFSQNGRPCTARKSF